MVDRPLSSLGPGGPRGPTSRGGPLGGLCNPRTLLRSVDRTNSCTSCTPSIPVVPGARRAPGGPDGPSTSNITPSRSYTGGLHSTSVQTAKYSKRYQRGIDLPRLFVFVCLFVTLFVFVFNKCKHDVALHTNAMFPFFSA